MTLNIELPDALGSALAEEAQAQGVSAAHLAQRVIERAFTENVTRPVSARIRDLWRDMPDEVRAKLPADGASQIDHYVYGHPKSNP